MTINGCNCVTFSGALVAVPPYLLNHPPTHTQLPHKRRSTSNITIPSASKSGGGFSIKSLMQKCEACGGQGAIECGGCKGTGRNKKNGNIFERWKCFDCQGFGMKTCPICGQGKGLTPEQRGER